MKLWPLARESVALLAAAALTGGIATAGCVTLPMGELLRVLRWLDPARSPRIQMGVR